ncbi:MAG: glutaminase, partial [Geminicoccaceae bacterium]
MFVPVGVDETTAAEAVSTGHLPDAKLVGRLLNEAYERYRTLDEGDVANYIPALARVPRELFGLCIVGVNGGVFPVGDAGHAFSIQSISKPFVFALVSEAIGCEPAREKIGVNATGLPFNSVMAVELNGDRTMNPMVNAGAIATTSLAPGDTAGAKWQWIRDGLSRFAGRTLELDEEVYRSEAETNLRNRGIAKLLEGYGRMYFDALEATDIYTRQCSLLVTARDLAVMGATLADGGVNPVTKERVIGHTTTK